MAQIDNVEAAMRLARAIASDISLYNEQKIVKGIEEDSFFELLEPEFEEGLAHYRSRVTPEIFETKNFFYRAVIDVILFRKAQVRSEIW